MTHFLQLLQIALENRERFDTAPTEEEWMGLIEEANRQAVVGVTLHALECLPEEQLPSNDLKLQWHVVTEYVRESNSDMAAKVAAVAGRLRKDGFDSVLLKGKGMAALYPDPSVRTSGDIDIWAWPKVLAEASLDKRRKALLTYARLLNPKCKVCYHHTSLPAIGGTKIELHFTPSWMNNPWANRFLQHRFDEYRTGNQYMAYHSTLKVNLPAQTFKVVYPIVHICRHLFSEGVGMRQIVDYYYVLRPRLNDEESVRQENEACMHDLNRLGLRRFTAALMWVLKEGLGLPDENLLCKPDERRGRFLLNEIILSGNFGQGDPRVTGMNDAPLPRRAMRKTTHNLRFFTLCPAEAFWTLGFKAWQWVMIRKWNKEVGEESLERSKG